MLITGIESDYESRGELMVLNCEILKHFVTFQRISRDFRMPGSIVYSRARVKNLMTPRERADT